MIHGSNTSGDFRKKLEPEHWFEHTKAGNFLEPIEGMKKELGQ